MLDGWIRTQRLGLAAYWLTLKPTRNDAALITRNVPLVLDFLEAELKTISQTDRAAASTLPVGVLSLLSQIPRGILYDSDLASLQPEWKAIRDTKLGHTTGGRGIPRFIGARILAYHILHGTARPGSIYKLAKAVFGHKWQESYEDIERLEALRVTLEVLRSPWHSTIDKVTAVDALGSELSSPAWLDVENLLFHQLFSWPLLVLSQRAFSLPVGVDVDFDDEQESVLLSNGAIVVSGWEPYLRRASEVARKMWRSKHGNFGSLREKVERVTVVYDFRWGDQIVSGFPERFALKDSSMQAYFSQVALSRLLGKAVSVSRVVTGGIGEERPGEFGNYEFEWPQGVVEKLEYAFETKSFQRIILPNLAGGNREGQQGKELSRFLYRYRYEQTTEMNFVATLQNVADSFQVGGWRQHTYIRCPEIAWRVHPSGQRLPTLETPAVRDCLKQLAGNEGTVLDLTDKAKPIDLAAALWRINIQLREQMYQRPPMISWAFVRVVPEEQDKRFWETIWQVVGASHKAFDDFLRTYSPEAAANQLKDVLNSFWPNERSRSQRAPDILVLIGTQHLSTSFANMNTPLLRCHAFDPILEHLKQTDMLNPVPDPSMRRLLGNTRVIIFGNDEADADDWDVYGAATEPIFEAIRGSLARLELTPAEDEQLNQLAVFRFGFTQQMASLLWENLGIDGVQVRYLLKRFTRKDLLRYGYGEYHMPATVRESLLLPDSPLAEAERHFAAAVSLAPYLSQGNVPGLAFDEALTTVHVHEANYHLSQALKLVPKENQTPLRNRFEIAYSRLLLFAEHPEWGVVNRLLRIPTPNRSLSVDVYEMAQDLLESLTESGSHVHPEHFLTAAVAAEKFWKATRSEGASEVVDEFGREIDSLFARAEEASFNPVFSSEKDFSLLRALAKRAAFLHLHRRFLTIDNIDETFAELSARVLELLQKGTPDVGGLTAWYESAGDQVRSDREAAKIYRLGTIAVPSWSELWIKLLGSTCLAVADRAVIENICEEMPEEFFHVAGYFRRDIKRDMAICKPWVKARWRSALNLLLERHQGAPEIREQLQENIRELMKWC